jgi:hypothetical protein
VTKDIPTIELRSEIYVPVRNCPVFLKPRRSGPSSQTARRYPVPECISDFNRDFDPYPSLT